VRNRLLLINTAFSGISQWVAVLYFALSLIVKMIIWRFRNTEKYHASRTGIEDYIKGRFGAGRGLEYVAISNAKRKSLSQ
jgi:hypothetical protein